MRRSTRAPETAAVFLLAVAGCGGALEDEDLTTLKTRASFDFDCPKSQIKTVTLDDRTRGVQGCGRRATYVQICQHQGMTNEDCTWVLNSGKRMEVEE
jgi:hypothetical protein